MNDWVAKKERHTLFDQSETRTRPPAMWEGRLSASSITLMYDITHIFSNFLKGFDSKVMGHPRLRYRLTPNIYHNPIWCSLLFIHPWNVSLWWSTWISPPPSDLTNSSASLTHLLEEFGIRPLSQDSIDQHRKVGYVAYSLDCLLVTPINTHTRERRRYSFTFFRAIKTSHLSHWFEEQQQGERTAMGNKVTTKTDASKELTAKGKWNQLRLGVALGILISTRNRIAPVNL